MELKVMEFSWNNEPPDGMCWKCPDCDSWATIAGNAGYHSKITNHQTPVLAKMPEPEKKLTKSEMLNDILGIVADNEADAYYQIKRRYGHLLK